MLVPPAFFDVFAAYFNADLVDLTDPAGVQQEADFCAAALVQRIPDLDGLIASLSAALHEWKPDFIKRCIDVTTTDWLFDEQAESSLKSIIAEIVKELQQHRALDG